MAVIPAKTTGEFYLVIHLCFLAVADTVAPFYFLFCSAGLLTLDLKRVQLRERETARKLPDRRLGQIPELSGQSPSGQINMPDHSTPKSDGVEVALAQDVQDFTGMFNCAAKAFGDQINDAMYVPSKEALEHCFPGTPPICVVCRGINMY